MLPSNNKIQTLLAELEEKAGKATPGEWAVEDPMDFELSIVEAGKQTYEWRFIASCSLPEDDEDQSFTAREVHANAAYIALASPSNIQAIAGYVRELEARLSALEEGLRPFARIGEHLERYLSLYPGKTLKPSGEDFRQAASLLPASQGGE